jgi:hypothetical protein
VGRPLMVTHLYRIAYSTVTLFGQVARLIEVVP